MMADPVRDLLALQRLQSGDEAALAELYDRYSTLLYGVAMRILRHPPEAEDALQEAWVQVWNQSSHYDPRRGSVGAKGQGARQHHQHHKARQKSLMPLCVIR